MAQYQLEIKQIVDYPRCRMYREFVQTLIEDRSIHTRGCSGLFHFVVLCSYANFRTSYRRLDGISYTIYPGEWICRLSELGEWLRLRTRKQILGALNALRDRNFITYTLLGRDKLVKYSITGWRFHNTVLDYNCPCQKDVGFFFLPVAVASELIGTGKCSEMDVVLDLWLSAIYNDERVQGSDVGPVVYLRNGTGNPLVSYAELAQRWGMSKATVCRVLKHLREEGYISLFSFPGRHGTVIYLQYYLSVMFRICDIKVDKAEVAMCLNLNITVEEPEEQPTRPAGDPKPDSVSHEPFSVSKRAEAAMTSKVLESLMMQGFSCADCPKFHYKLYRLSCDCKGALEKGVLRNDYACYQMELFCSTGKPTYAFELNIRKSTEGENDNAKEDRIVR